MLKSNSFLAVDFGAGSLKLAEFEGNEAGGLVLRSYAIKPLGLEGSQETKREALILKKLQETIAEKASKPRRSTSARRASMFFPNLSSCRPSSRAR